ncbi:riboflavin synthase [Persephonella sp.]|nr:riboflavin synthase [Aquificota bacterium]
MFTGIVEEVGTVLQTEPAPGGLRLKVRAEKVIQDTKLGDSIAVNGVCLTVVDITEGDITFDVSRETVERSNIGKLKTGEPVNLERALRPSDRLGGHIVQGHVDTVGRISSITPEGEHTRFRIEFSPEYSDLVVEKGSIAVDGISLTINKINGSTVSINIIPHTIENTNLRSRKVGDEVNIEFDIIGKYVLRMVGGRKKSRLEELLDNF